MSCRHSNAVSSLMYTDCSICSWPNSRTEMPMKPKMGRVEAHNMANPWSYLEVKRAKFKVNRPINAHTVNVQYRPNSKAYQLHTSYPDGARIPVSRTSAVTAKVKRRKVTCVWQVLADKSRTKRHRNTKIGRNVALSRPIMCTSFKVKGQSSRSPCRLMLWSG